MAQRLRVIAYNVLEGSGYNGNLDHRPRYGWVPERLAEELGRYGADVVSFSEAPIEAVVQRIAEWMGMTALFIASGQHWPGAILTRLPVVSFTSRPGGADRSAELFTRHWGRAELRTADGKTLVVHSAHLYPHEQEGREMRRREMEVMSRVIAADLDQGADVLVQGDLNHQDDGSEYPRWGAIGLTDTFAAAGSGGGWTYDSRNPHRRLDYIWAGGTLAPQVRECRVLREGAFVLDGKTEVALSDHLPLMATFGE